MDGSYDEFLRYVGLLDEGDLLALFDIVKAGAETISEAARRCGVERKTIYDMMKEGKQVKQKTKERILKAALTMNLERSMEVLLAKTVSESRDIYANYVSLTYQDAMRAKTAVEFEKTLSRFESIFSRVLILANLEKEVGALSNEFASKAEELGAMYTPPIPKLLDSGTLAATLPPLIEELLASRNPNLSALSEKWRISPSIVRSMSDTLGSISKFTIQPITLSATFDASNVTRDFLNLRFASRTNPEMYRGLHLIDDNAGLVTIPTQP
ncbi:MAG TPA: hypothetical protein VJZ75_04495 [Candidatus Bathyarchaeia archaeon]|nr:hypothetical protein [Candidatus Bathyarchaeia archaeon]